MLKQIKVVLIISLTFFSCINEKNKQSIQNNDTDIIGTKKDENKEDFQDQYIIVNVSDRAKEKTDDVELRTTRLKNGNLITTFKAGLGSFEDDHYYDVELRFVRKSDNTKLEIGTYHLVAFADGVKVQPKTDLYFEYINTISGETYNNIILSGAIESFPDEFYAPFNKKNLFVIESTKDLGSTENSTAIISEKMQRIKGYFEFEIIKIRTNKVYKLRVEFNVINEIRIFEKTTSKN